VDTPKFDNIRGLVQDLAEQLDNRMVELRKSSPATSVRPADAKVFMLIARHPRSLSQLAMAMDISRQAAHAAVQRLVEHGVIRLEFAQGSKRDKIPQVTEKGHKIRQLVARHLSQLEEEMVGPGLTKAACD